MKSRIRSLGPSPFWLSLGAACLLGAAFPQQTAWSAPVTTPQAPKPKPQPQSPIANAKGAVTDAMLMQASRAGKDWVMGGSDYGNQRFSALRQVNSKNVQKLAIVSIAQTGYAASFEATPIVVDGVMYVSTPMVNGKQAVMAMNAASGETLWTYVYSNKFNQPCCGPVNRGVAVAYGHVFLVTLDDRLIALDAHTGHEVWKSKVADAHAGYAETMAPQIFENMVIIGSAGGEWPLRGFVAAYDAITGKQRWRWNTTDSKGTWSGDSWKTGGGPVWSTPAIDAKRRLVIFAVGNPNPDFYGDGRIGDNLYTDSIVALHVKTGKLAWYYQQVKHDLWDYDSASNVVLFDADDKGKTTSAAGEASKDGWFYIVNRLTGKLIRKSDPFVIQKHMFSAPTKEGVTFQPGPSGGSEWSPPAYSPMTHMTYVLGLNVPMTLTGHVSPNLPGVKRFGSTLMLAKGGVTSGTFSAINVNTGKIAWQYQAPQPMVGGALATAGNLVFVGEGNGWLDAFDATSGKKLWRSYLGAGVNAPPVAYQVAGREYIAVAAGGNFLRHTPVGDAVAIFSMPR